MIFLDLNTFFGDRAGGIRTYHLAKIAWFKQHPEHTYIVAGPGKRRHSEQLAPNIERVWLKGLATTSDPEGYRLLIDLPEVLSLLRTRRPDIVEAGDPWLSGPLLFAARALGCTIPLLTSFYHSDPIRTYITPWSRRNGVFRLFRRIAAAPVAPLFYWAQRHYSLTLASSAAMESHLKEHNVPVARTPFGAPQEFLDKGAECAPLSARSSLSEGSEAPTEQPLIRLVYSGRLDPEKGVDLLAAAIPHLLNDGRFELTVLGRGSREQLFRNPKWLDHPRYRVVGYLADRNALLELLSTQHLLLSTCPWETFGLGILEAFALGIPAVAPRSGGAGELVEELDERCLYSPGTSGAFDDPEQLIRAIDQTVALGLEPLSRKARAIAEQYGSWNDAIGRIVERSTEELLKPEAQ